VSVGKEVLFSGIWGYGSRGWAVERGFLGRLSAGGLFIRPCGAGGALRF